MGTSESTVLVVQAYTMPSSSRDRRLSLCMTRKLKYEANAPAIPKTDKAGPRHKRLVIPQYGKINCWVAIQEGVLTNCWAGNGGAKKQKTA